MSIGAGIFLITVGAILAFAVRDRGGALDLTVAGVVIMLAGAVGIWLSYNITNRRRRVETKAVDPAAEEEYRAVQQGPAAPVAVPRTAPAAGTDGASAPAAPVPEPESEPESEPDDAGRHVDLDPAASDLHVPVPDRSAPPSAADREVPVPVPTPSGSWRDRLVHRFRPRR